MIRSFKSKETEMVWNGYKSAKFPAEIQHIARRKLRMIHNSVNILDLKIPPANRLEKLKGDKTGYFSIRTNDKWRIVFSYRNGHAYEVQITDYH
jgi:proteic killer suppression protein